MFIITQLIATICKLFSGLKVPYPVPFRWELFRDAVKGWIDITVRCINVML